MSFRLVLIIVFIQVSLAAVLFAQDEPEAADEKKTYLPTDPQIMTQKKMRENHCIWFQCHAIDGYTMFGKHSDKWDDRAESFITEMTRYHTELPEAKKAEELLVMAKELEKLGCDDPQVQFWHGKLLLDLRWPAAAEAKLQGIPEKLKEAGYPKVIQFLAWRNFAKALHHLGYCGKSDHRYAYRTGLKALITAVDEGEFTEDEYNQAYAYMVMGCNGHSRWYYLRRLLKGKRDFPSWVRKMIEAHASLEDWSDAWNSKDTEEQRQQKETKYKGKARKLFEAAWEEMPNLPQAPWQRLKLLDHMPGKQDSEKKLWLARTVKARFDFPHVYETMFDERVSFHFNEMTEDPELMSLAENCLNTKRYDTDVPMRYLYAMRKLALSKPFYQWRSFFRRPGRMTVIQELLDHMEACPDRKKDRDRIVAQKALCYLWAGDYSKAEKLLKALSVRPDVEDGFCGASLSWQGRHWQDIDTEIRLFTGDHRKDLQEWEKLCTELKFGEAQQIFDRVLTNLGDDMVGKRYLVKRAYLMKNAESFSKVRRREQVLWRILDDDETVNTKYLIQWGIGLEELNSIGSTPLMRVLDKNRPELAWLLIKHGANLDAVNDRHATACHFAMNAKDRKLGAAVLAKSSQFDAADNKNATPLYWACLKGIDDLALQLLERGARTNVVKSNRYTIFQAAARTGCRKSVEFMLAHGVDVNELDPRGNFPIHAAAEGKANSEIIKLLLEKGADINARSKTGQTPLMRAASDRRIQNVKFLVEQGADINAVCEKGANALYYAVDGKKIDKDLVSFLVAKKLNPSTARNGWTPTMMVAWYNHAEALEMLLDAGADIDYVDKYGRRLLSVCIQAGALNTAKVLLKRGVPIDARNTKNGQTALWVAVKTGKKSAVKLLLEHGANAEIADNDGKLPIDVAKNSKIKDLLKPAEKTSKQKDPVAGNQAKDVEKKTK